MLHLIKTGAMRVRLWRARWRTCGCGDLFQAHMHAASCAPVLYCGCAPVPETVNSARAFLPLSLWPAANLCACSSVQVLGLSPCFIEIYCWRENTGSCC